MEETQSSSRTSLAGAGWNCAEIGIYKHLIPRRTRPLSWLNPVPLWQARNDVLARRLGDPTNDMRRAWMNELGLFDPTNQLTVERSRDQSQTSFLVVGDPGEGDASQYAVVPVLEKVGGDTDFMVVCSDVIYPAGGADEYRDKFYRPYKNYMHPIYALPGNHDWYDGLNGFMNHFCSRTPAPTLRSKSGWRGNLRKALWRTAPTVSPTAIERMKMLRGDDAQSSSQPGPYFAIETGPVLLVAIDTGILGDIDREQGEWLRAISGSNDKPKILLTGKPIYVNGQYHPGNIEGGGTVDEIITDGQSRYVAAIGGDIHNYQRYPVTLADGRAIQYVVAGGGGAFMHSTHDIPNIDESELRGVTEAEFHCYPLRGDSLAAISARYNRRLGWLLGNLEIPPDEAAELIAKKIGLVPTRPSARGAQVSDKSRRAFAKMFKRSGRFQGLWHHNASQFFDWNDPPLFKSFLRVDVSKVNISIKCYVATGCLEHEIDPQIEDAVTIDLAGVSS